MPPQQQTSNTFENSSPFDVHVTYQPPQVLTSSPPIAAYDVPAPAATSPYNHMESGDERSPSVGSSLQNGSSFSSQQQVTPGSSPPANHSPGWQKTAVDQQTDCNNCTTSESDQNKCMYCGIIFLEPTMHMIHMGWHGKEHPFQCHTCGQICKDKYSFTTHIFKSPHL